MSNHLINDHKQEKESLLDQLKSLVKQCQDRFVCRYELATENDPLVVDLCLSIENIFYHGLKKSKRLLTKNKLLGSSHNPKNEAHFWNFLTLFLNEHEVKRFSTLRNVHTDLGRQRSWIRNSLNEHSLERYFLIIIEDKHNYRQQYYHDWALLFDDKNIELTALSKSLNSILFALNIDIADIDVTSPDSQTDDESTNLAPVRRRNEDNVLIKSEKKKDNIIIIENEIPDCYAKSAPVNSFIKPNISTTQVLVDDEENLSNDKRSVSTQSVNDTSNEIYLYPIPIESNESDHSNSSTSNELMLNEKIISLQKEKDKIVRENNLLNIQIKKYIATIELMKYNKITTENESRKNLIEKSEIENYEKKLVQVSEMHGEIIEFNEHLYKVIQIKDHIIARLRNELIELRGPLPDNDDIMSISTEVETAHSLQSLLQPLIHIWIPTAFLSSGFKGKSHHIYQIYVRIKEEEWNVYRRYSQFHSLHKTLKAQYPCISRFEFPPKKAIGNKDSKVVQERRKKLESYLRNVINHIQTKINDINNKTKFISILPFLSDKYFLQDRSQSESNLNNPQQQSTSSRNYMGF